MSDTDPPPRPLRLHAFVHVEDRVFVRKTAALLARSLSNAGAAPYTIECAFPTTLAPLDAAPSPVIVIASWRHEADRIHDPWDTTETRLRHILHQLRGEPARIVYLYTIFRHVAPDHPNCRAIRARIRRLNLLAINLSHELGLLIADIDRDLADFGADALQTDYRLHGSLACFAAARSLALTILHAGHDEAVPFEIQDAARRRLVISSLPHPAASAPGPNAIGEFGYLIKAGRLSQIAMRPDPRDL